MLLFETKLPFVSTCRSTWTHCPYMVHAYYRWGHDGATDTINTNGIAAARVSVRYRAALLVHELTQPVTTLVNKSISLPSWCKNIWIVNFLPIKFWKSHIKGIGRSIDTERKGCESIGSGTHFVALNFDLPHDLDLQLSWSNFEKAVFHEWEG